MGLKIKLLQLAGKEAFNLDERIGIRYLFRLCWKYGWMMIRGRIASIGHSEIADSVFLGYNVKLYEKRYIQIGEKAKIHDGVKIDALSINGVTIGSYCVIGPRSSIQCTGDLASVGIGVKMGSHTTFGNDCFFGAAGGITIGNDVIAGQCIRFHSENHNYRDLSCLIRKQGVTHKGIVVGNNCWIGSGAVFLDGASVGNGCVIAANAVVTKKFPDNSIIGGVPAKILGTRT